MGTMRILIAPDKFKGSLGSIEVAAHIADGLRDVLPHADITILPIADGGEGTAAVICSAAEGEWRACEAHDALGHRIEARYCAIESGQTAVLEMSEAAGLWRVPLAVRNPNLASSSGVGEMLLAAAHGRAEQIVIGLGGSATNDGGFGMARALGFQFIDEKGAELTGLVSDLQRLTQIRSPGSLKLPPITAAFDAANPLLGAAGATQMFGRQKGATAAQLEGLERALARLAEVAAQTFGVDDRDVPGAGAAGGLGFGLRTFCGAELRSGFDIVAAWTGLESAIAAADIVVTGEGRLDLQTLQGKAPAGVARLARKHGRPVYAIVGELEDAPAARALFDGVAVLTAPDVTRADALCDAPELLRRRARELAAQLRL